MIHVELIDITKRYGETTVLSNVSLAFDQGEFTSLLGPSGCGKTTLLRTISGFIKPEKGSIWIEGKLVNDVPPYRRNLGMVFQNYALWPHMTVYENIAFGLRMKGIKNKAEMEKLVKEALKVVRLVSYEQRYPVELSGGQQQRVAIARAIVVEPAALLLDEPLSNLDRKLRVEMQVELKLIQKKLGITTIYVTHDQEEALSLSDRVVVMSQGKIEQTGTPMDIYENPRNKYVASFIGAANFFEGKVTSMINDSLMKVRTAEAISLLVPREGDLGQDSDVVIYVRPEKVEISPEKPDSEENVFVGTTKYVTYQGSTARYGIQIANGYELIVDETLAKKQYKQNDIVYVKLHPKFLCKG